MNCFEDNIEIGIRIYDPNLVIVVDGKVYPSKTIYLCNNHLQIINGKFYPKDCNNPKIEFFYSTYDGISVNEPTEPINSLYDWILDAVQTKFQSLTSEEIAELIFDKAIVMKNLKTKNIYLEQYQKYLQDLADWNAYQARDTLNISFRRFNLIKKSIVVNAPIDIAVKEKTFNLVKFDVDVNAPIEIATDKTISNFVKKNAIVNAPIDIVVNRHRVNFTKFDVIIQE